MRALLLVLALAACTEAANLPEDPVIVTPDGGPGYPPKMGEVAGSLGGEIVAWWTYDFSIGAFDASAWVEHFDGPYRLHLTAYPPRDPGAKTNLLRVSGQFAGRPATGSLQKVEIVIGDGGPWVATRATLVVERIDAPAGSGYGRAAGWISASYCPANPAIGAPCRLFEARFDTMVQFDG